LKDQNLAVLRAVEWVEKLELELAVLKVVQKVVQKVEVMVEW
jgi:hypothetical protein